MNNIYFVTIFKIHNYFHSEQVASKNVVLQPRESFVLRSEAAVTQTKSYAYFRYIISDLWLEAVQNAIRFFIPTFCQFKRPY